MFALIDGNNFYCSCERAYRPELRQQPVIVLSNNDGCVISRSNEAKDMGIRMGVPYFQIQHLVRQDKLIVFSSNYELYADLSRRMMSTIASLVPAIEIYSIDECFASLHGLNNLHQLGHNIRSRIQQWVGIPTCVGIAPTRTLAKFCNHLAKRHRHHFNGVVVWTDWNQNIRQRALASEPVTEIWGIGRRTGHKLAAQGIHTALDFINAHTPTLRKQFGVVLERTQREMQGIPCSELITEEAGRQNIVRSRSFGNIVTNLDGLQAAISHHITAGAAKLREQNSQAHIIGVFIYTNRFRHDLPQYNGYRITKLPQASNDTLTLNHIARHLLNSIYRSGYEYKKCGIELSGIEPAHTFRQLDLLCHSQHNHRPELMRAWDNITSRYGRSSIRLGSELQSGDWLMTRTQLSNCITTRFKEILTI
ncbi:DNA polymerase V UmuC [Snodgrassella alvi]|uniref:Y-family DNA polymerase n=1 Tax=Snodgrassella alvi TaxID=1196083 RepID=UPI0009FD134D|nr:Y-family DNA polymerase [Snodgrassella alvi]ORF06326.1 DNA polymerase V UmuC [Snodgrassella alvi]ORF14401.1 DNA polymerase V UmuC [Snodgrassella alvi]ORF19227.1 DNA polymerase V UmuC [Snodgrassella alvi]ORF19247.1 DNA polymerase V UmuC [Snodgrassella alvi]